MKDLVKNTKVTIEIDEPAITITAETPRLILRSVLPEDVLRYQAMFADPDVMAYFGDGKPRLYKDETSEKNEVIDYAQDLLLSEHGWCNRWKQGDPFSGYTLILKDQNAIIGNIVILQGGVLAYFIDKPYWGKQYGTEAAMTMCNAIFPAITLAEISKSHLPTQIEATAHPDNPASCKILEKTGMKHDPTITEKEFNGKKYPRKGYTVLTKDLVDDYMKIKKHLPLYELIRKTSNRNLPENLVNVGGYSLRQRKRTA